MADGSDYANFDCSGSRRGTGVKDTASAVVTDAYAGLKALVKKGLGGGPGAELVRARHEQAPETWHAPLMAELAETGADSDRDLIAAAQALLDLVGEAEGRAGKYTADVRAPRACRSGITTGKTTCSMPGRAARALQMTGSAEPGHCGTTVRARAGHSLEAAGRNARDYGVHQLRISNVSGSGRQVRVAGSGGMRPGGKLASCYAVDRLRKRRIGDGPRAHRIRLVAFLIAEGGGCW